MSETPKAFIVISKCSQSNQSFGIRFEEKSRGQWLADWAFSIKESMARREGYDRTEISGSFGLDSIYPSCPLCKNPSIVKCGCGKVSCWDGENQTVMCLWCKRKSRVGGQINSLDVGKD